MTSKKIIISVLFLSSLIFLFVCLIFQNNGQTQIAEISLYQRFLNSEAKSLKNHFDHIQGMAQMMASNGMILNRLESTKTTDKDSNNEHHFDKSVNTGLKNLAAISDISAAFVMDIDGHCILSSNAKFIGKNYSFRPYFKQALKNGFGIYCAMGITSRKIGVYYSVAIYHNNQVIGVAVLKFAPSFFHVAALPAFVKNAGNESGEILGLALNDGIIIIPTTAKVYSLSSLTSAKIKSLATNKQFPPGSIINAGFPRTSWQKLQKQGYIHALRKPEQQVYHLFTTPFFDKKLYLIHIISENRFNTAYTPLSQNQKNMFNLLYGLLVMLILMIILFAAYHYKYRKVSARLLQEQFEYNRSLTFYQNVINASPIGFWQVDPDTNIVKSVNNTLCEMLRLPQEKIIDRKIFDFYADIDLPAVKVKTENIYREKKFVLQCQLKKYQDLSFTTVMQYSQLIDDPTLDIKQYVSFFSDISSTIQQKKELHLMVSALEQSENTVLITDSDGSIEYVNQAMVTVSGYSREECLGQNPRILKSDTHDTAFFQEMWQTLLSGKTWKNRIQSRKKSGDLHWEQVVISPIFNLHGMITHYIAIKTDIAQQVEMELQLQRALSEAHSLNNAKSEFLANMSHEIRTPMNAIIGMSRLALDSGLKGKQYELVSSVHSAANSLLGLLNDILDFSKIEVGQLEINRQAFSLLELLDAIEKTMSVLIEEKGVNFNVDFEQIPEFIIADEFRMRQIIINLINNAVKFTKQGSITLKVSSEETITGTRLRFDIVDTGIGISKEKQQTIFGSFTQADSSIAREYGGTGLGLTICKQLVELMDGTISLQSEPGKGSTFSFSLPVSTSTEQELINDTPLEAQITRNLYFLVVDDNEMNLKLAKMVLEQYDHHVTLAQDGVQALEILSERDFDLVLMDVQMPIMDGIVATQIIRKYEQGNSDTAVINHQLNSKLNEKLLGGHLRIIAMTANAMKGDKENCLAAGMDSYLTKPFSPEDILRVINSFSLSDR